MLQISLHQLEDQVDLIVRMGIIGQDDIDQRDDVAVIEKLYPYWIRYDILNNLISLSTRLASIKSLNRLGIYSFHTIDTFLIATFVFVNVFFPLPTTPNAPEPTIRISS